MENRNKKPMDPNKMKRDDESLDKNRQGNDMDNSSDFGNKRERDEHFTDPNRSQTGNNSPRGMRGRTEGEH